MSRIVDSSSYKDPSGYIFYENDEIFRSIDESYRENYEELMCCGLYSKLVEKQILIRHDEVSESASSRVGEYKVIKPQKVPFVSYPYEWSFSMLKDAALTTISIMSLALQHGMVLKDASAYNIQFMNGHPIFIDTLSFEKYNEGEPWIAYGQFCRHFVAPLALMAYTDVRISALLVENIDGIPLDMTIKLLPYKARFNIGLIMHLYAHTMTIKKTERKFKKYKLSFFSYNSMLALLDSLETTIKYLQLKKKNTEWANYYNSTVYNNNAFNSKKEDISELLSFCGEGIVIDLGANDGTMSRIAAQNNRLVIACDKDPVAVEKNYLKVKQNAENNILPLVIDLLCPSPAIGWANLERKSFLDRIGDNNIILALALIHHIAITSNIPFQKLVECFQSFGKYVILEFVPKNDENVISMLINRKDIFPNYSINCFNSSMNSYYKLIKSLSIRDSNRILNCYERK